MQKDVRATLVSRYNTKGFSQYTKVFIPLYVKNEYPTLTVVVLQEDLKQESVNHQFEKVRTETNTSHVEEYGDIDIGNTKLSEVIGYRSQPLARYQLDFTVSCCYACADLEVEK